MARRTKPSEAFLQDLIERGVPEPVLLDSENEKRLRDAWRARYRRSLELAPGPRSRLDYEWHAFSYVAYPCLDLEAALEAYRGRQGPVVVISAWNRTPPIGARCDVLPSFDLVRRRTLPPDLLVFPEDLRWTFAMTHEAGWLGPYFADARP